MLWWRAERFWGWTEGTLLGEGEDDPQAPACVRDRSAPIATGRIRL